LQAWLSARLGATGSFFWSFSDDASGASWNEYRLPATQATFSPFFLSNTQVTVSKHSEAIREGMEDFEYLNALRATGDAAGTLFDTALSAVLQATDLQWTTSKDRTAADSMRMTIAGALGWLPPPPPPPPVTPMLVLNAATATYDGQAHSAQATAVGDDGSAIAGSIEVTYSPGDSTPPVNAGAYIVTAVFSSADGRYTDASATATLVIQPATPIVTVTEYDAVSDGTAHAASASATGVDGVPVAGSIEVSYVPGDGDPPVAAGTYAVTAVFTSADSNYAGATATGTLIITAQPPAPEPVASAEVIDAPQTVPPEPVTEPEFPQDVVDAPPEIEEPGVLDPGVTIDSEIEDSPQP